MHQGFPETVLSMEFVGRIHDVEIYVGEHTFRNGITCKAVRIEHSWGSDTWQYGACPHITHMDYVIDPNPRVDWGMVYEFLRENHERT